VNTDERGFISHFVVVKHMLNIRRPQAVRGYSRCTLQQRPLKRAEMYKINLTTTDLFHICDEMS